MAATLNSQAIAIVNALMVIGQDLNAKKSQIDALSNQYTQLTLGSELGAMPTCPVNPDGTLGDATVSPPPTGAEIVIDPRQVVGLSRAISASDIGGLLTGLEEVSKLLGGGPIAQQGQMPQILAKITGG